MAVESAKTLEIRMRAYRNIAFISLGHGVDSVFDAMLNIFRKSLETYALEVGDQEKLQVTLKVVEAVIGDAVKRNGKTEAAGTCVDMVLRLADMPQVRETKELKETVSESLERIMATVSPEFVEERFERIWSASLQKNKEDETASSLVERIFSGQVQGSMADTGSEHIRGGDRDTQLALAMWLDLEELVVSKIEEQGRVIARFIESHRDFFKEVRVCNDGEGGGEVMAMLEMPCGDFAAIRYYHDGHFYYWETGMKVRDPEVRGESVPRVYLMDGRKLQDLIRNKSFLYSVLGGTKLS